jgi:lipopolysaccharide transport system ATP-binding protein
MSFESADTPLAMEKAVIEVREVGKCYQIYERPQDRLKQMLWQGRRRYYREFWALRDVSFSISRGETVGVIGRNGSGKSTLLKMLCGTLTPTVGTVTIQGRVAALLELGTGFNPEFTGRENVYLNAAILGLDDVEIERYLPEILAFADIGDFIDQPVKTYSSGMAVRLAFAVIAHVRADILVIDEALAVGDVFFVQKCMRFLREFKQRGTLFFVSHDTGAVVNLCDRVVWLDQGQIREVGPAKEVCQHYLAILRETQAGVASEKLECAADFDSSMEASIPQSSTPTIDQRLAFINQTAFRNDIELFTFRREVAGYGTGGIQILDARFEDEQRQSLQWMVGGERVSLIVYAVALANIHDPIIGFYIKDRLGQNLFGDNTYLSYLAQSRLAMAGQYLKTTFTFQMPVMPIGDYTVDIAVASGTQQDHITHCWCNDVLVFKSHASSVHQGLIGLPMLNIKLTIGELEAVSS